MNLTHTNLIIGLIAKLEQMNLIEIRCINSFSAQTTEKHQFSIIQTMFAKTFLLLLLVIHFSIGSFINTEQNLFKTWKNSTFYAFRGIKYGEAPIGPLRFKVKCFQSTPFMHSLSTVLKITSLFID